jgi:hypothetical protein
MRVDIRVNLRHAREAGGVEVHISGQLMGPIIWAGGGCSWTLSIVFKIRRDSVRAAEKARDPRAAGSLCCARLLHLDAMFRATVGRFIRWSLSPLIPHSVTALAHKLNSLSLSASVSLHSFLQFSPTPLYPSLFHCLSFSLFLVLSFPVCKLNTRSLARLTMSILVSSTFSFTLLTLTLSRIPSMHPSHTSTSTYASANARVPRRTIHVHAHAAT